MELRGGCRTAFVRLVSVGDLSFREKVDVPHLIYDKDFKKKRRDVRFMQSLKRCEENNERPP